MRVNIGEHNLDKSYQYYLTERRKSGELVVKDPVSSKEYKAIANHYLKGMKEALLEGKEVNLGAYLGTLQVSKKPLNLEKLAFDYPTYNREGIKNFYLNEHTGGFRFRFRWGKKHCLVKGKKPYCFQPARGMKRELAQRLSKPNAEANYVQD